jgi:arylsulfatase A-like enzyme
VKRLPAILIFGLVCAACGDREPRNLLLVTIDTLRADHLSSYGYPRATSPAIDRLAEQGVVFTQAIAHNPTTWPSLTSLHTSMHPHRHGVWTNGAEIAPGIETLAEVLADQGWDTAASLANMVNAPHRGFEGRFFWSGEDRDEHATEAAIAWLRDGAREPFFLWLHLFGPHAPYDPEPAFFRAFDTGYRGELDARHETLDRIYREQRELTAAELAHIVALYDGDVAEADARVGAVLDALDGLGLGRRTLVVFSSDHGEQLYDKHRYFLHAQSAYDATLRLPLILRLPGELPAGQRADALVRGIDVAPTILDLLNVTQPVAFEGRSLLPLIRGEATVEPVPVISTLGRNIHSIRTPRWHYLYNPHLGFSYRSYPIEPEELYDVVRDPKETRNLVGERPDVAAALRERLESWIESHEPAPAPQISDEAREELRALGYVVDEPESSHP